MLTHPKKKINEIQIDAQYRRISQKTIRKSIIQL